MTDWGAEHAHSINVRPVEYANYMDAFLHDYVQDF